MRRRVFLTMTATGTLSFGAGCTSAGSSDSTGGTTVITSTSSSTTRTTPSLHRTDATYDTRFTPHGAWSNHDYTATRTGYNPHTDPPRSQIGAAWVRTPIRGHRTWLTTPPVTDDHRVFVGSGSGNRTSRNHHGGFVAAFDGKTGNRVWRTTITPGEVNGVARAEKQILGVSTTYGPPTGTLTALSAKDGTKQWQANVGALPFGDPVIVGEQAYISSYHDGLTAVSLDGQRRWTHSVGHLKEHASTAPCATEHSIFVGTDRGRIIAFAIEDGHVQWESSIVTDTDLPRIQSVPAVAHDTVFISGTDYRLHAISTADGTERWATRLLKVNSHNTIPSPVITEDAVYVSTMNGGLIALQPDDGHKQWMRGNTGSGQPPAAADDLILMPTDGSVQAFTAHGDRRWSFTLPSYHTEMGAYIMNPELALAHDRVYVSLNDGRVFALSTAA